MKLVWINIRYYPDTFLERLRGNPGKTSVRIDGIRAEASNRDEA
jgi:hypothetical protein